MILHWRNLVLSMSLLCPVAALATEVTATFSGAISYITDLNNVAAPLGIVNGTPYETTVTYDTSTSYDSGSPGFYYTGTFTTTFYPASGPPVTLGTGQTVSIVVRTSAQYMTFIDYGTLGSTTVDDYFFVGNPNNASGPITSPALPGASELTALTQLGYFMRFDNGQCTPTECYTLDISGSLTSYSITETASPGAAVPEPGSISVLLAAAGAMAALRRQRRPDTQAAARIAW